MTKSFPSWITKEMLKGVNGFNLDAYLMALEGWRRGLTLTWYYDLAEVSDLKIIGFNPLGKSFSLGSKNDKSIHYFYRSRGDKVLNEAVVIVHEKHETKKYFNESGVPTPNGVIIDIDTEKEDVLNLISKLNYPLVVKPELGSLGKGVTTEIQNKEELFKAMENIENKYEYYNQLIIEEHFEGEEYRAYVVDDQVVAVTKRVPANVPGNGQSTITQLVEEKNKERELNPYLAEKLIELDDTVINFLSKKHMTLDDIPEQGEIIQLKGQANISAGGDPLDATDDLNESHKNVVVEAVQSIPGLIHAGVDIIVNGNDITVLEINATADIAMHVFPKVGKPRNVSAEIINYYFPNTIDDVEGKSNIYFDYKDVQSVLRRKLAQQLTLTNAPQGKFSTVRYIISGKVQKVGFRKWIRKQAIQKGLHGYTRNLNKNKVVVIVGGNEKDVKDFKKTCEKGPTKAKVEKVRQLKWKSSIKLGFEIRKSK